MEKEKQIEEMAEAIYKSGVAIEGTDIAFGLYDTDTHFHLMAAKLYNAGYGNVKKERLEAYKEGYEQGKFDAAIETKKQTARDCLKILHGIGGCDATEDCFKGWDAAIDGAYKEISDKYGVTAFDEEVCGEND